MDGGLRLRVGGLGFRGLGFRVYRGRILGSGIRASKVKGFLKYERLPQGRELEQAGFS